MNGSKVTIELDLNNANDRQLLEVISRVRASQQQGQEVSVANAVRETTKSEIPTSQSLIDSGKQVTQAANELGEKLPGPKTKMSNSERARAGARARWARKKAAEQGLPMPPTAKEKKKAERKAQRKVDGGLDFSKAKEEPISNYPVEMTPFEAANAAHNRALESLCARGDEVDGREIIDGSYVNRPEFNEEGSSVDLPEFMDDNYLEEIRERAKQYEE